MSRMYITFLSAILLAPATAASAGPFSISGLSYTTSISYAAGANATQSSTEFGTFVDHTSGAGNAGLVTVQNTGTIAADNAFRFLTNAIAYGNAHLTTTTTLYAVITNNGSTPQALDWQAQYTPGTLAGVILGNNTSLSADTGVNILLANGDYRLGASFGADFNDRLSFSSRIYDTFHGSQHIIEELPTSHEIALTPDTGQALIQGGPAYARNWSATDYAVNVGANNPNGFEIGPGESRSIAVVIFGDINLQSDCSAPPNCSAVQFAFGDPNRNGPAFVAQGLLADAGFGLTPFVGRGFSLSAPVIPQAVVSGTPLPSSPPPLPAPVFTTPVGPSPIPEPGTFGLFALALARFARRRRI